MTEEQALSELNKLAELGPDEYFHRAESKEVVTEAMKWLEVIVNDRAKASKFAKALQYGIECTVANSVHDADYGKFDERKDCQRIEKNKLKKGVITHD